MSFFHSTDDQTALEEALPSIEKELELAENKLPPTASQRDAMRATVLRFAAERSRIVYGGYALHLLIKNASKGKEGIYTDTNQPDVEFYTPHLKNDVRDLCDRLHSEGFVHVFAEEAVHPSTFKIKAEFVEIADVSFIPTPLFNTMPYIDVDDIRVVHPELAMIDVFRVYGFPLNNFQNNRLKKTFTRANLLLKYYPLDFSDHKSIAQDKGDVVLEMLISKGVFSKDMIITGQVAQNMFCKAAGIQQDPLSVPILAISTSYHDDIHRISKVLDKKPKSFLPFTELLGRKKLFYHKGQPVLLVIEESETCVSYVDFPDFPKVTTIQCTAFYSFCLMLQYRMQKNAREVNRQRRILHMLITSKKEFYKNNPSLHVTSPSPFQEFVVRCAGEAVNVFKKYGLERKNRKGKGIPLKYRYTPGEPITSYNNRAFMAMNTYLTVGQEERPSKGIQKED